MAKKTAGKGLAQAIREEVERRGGTLDGLSRELELQGNALSRWCNLNEPTPPFYDVLMQFLDVTQDELGGMFLVDRRRRWELKHHS